MPVGYSVLETSRLGRIPHASVCGGRGRCSTCRIRIVRGLESLPAASAEELVVLKSVGAAPNMRLACQLRPTSDLSVIPLLPVTATARDGYARPDYIAGQEKEICVLFADLRGFTRLSASVPDPQQQAMLKSRAADVRGATFAVDATNNVRLTMKAEHP